MRVLVFRAEKITDYHKIYMGMGFTCKIATKVLCIFLLGFLCSYIVLYLRQTFPSIPVVVVLVVVVVVLVLVLVVEVVLVLVVLVVVIVVVVVVVVDVLVIVVVVVSVVDVSALKKTYRIT